MSLPLNKVSSQFVLQIPNSGQKATFAALSATPENSTNYYSPFIRSERFCDLRKFGADVIMDVRSTHPTIIIKGTLQENLFFVPPEGFLRAPRARPPAKKAAL